MKISFWRRLLDLISPRLCFICGCRLAPSESILCVSCLLSLPYTRFWLSPLDNPMARLFWGKFPIEGAVALFFYEPHSEACNPIYDLKYHGSTEVGNELGSLLAHYCTEHGCLTGVDAIVPVPLTRRRQRHRGYNQSMEIARGISQLTGLPIYNKVLRRTNFKGSQTQKDTLQRMQNVEDAFLLTDAAAIRGKHLLLVDDVVTTGATISACARQLCLAGDVRISILSLGFVRH